MLFHFFQKNTTITDTYILDTKRNIKLYPVKSSCIKGSATNSGFKMLANRLNNTQGKMEIEIYHSTSEIISGYIWAREDAASPYQTQGFYLSGGLTQYQLYWGSTGSTTAALNVSALTNDSTYKVTITWNATNHSFKFNKVTKVNNVITYGPDIVSSTGNVGSVFSTKDVGILCGNIGSGAGALAFCSKHRVNYFKVYDTDQTTLTACFNFAEGGGTKVYNSVTGVEYQLSNVTEALIWANKQDFNHYNFYKGHTLYTKDGSLSIRIPNKCDGTEIVPSVVPSGYVKVANYKGTSRTFNQCESKFKLDDVNPLTDLLVAGATDAVLNGAYQRHGDYAGKSYWYDGDLSTYTHFFNWDGSAWFWGRNGGVKMFESYENVDDPWDVVTWVPVFGTLPTGTIIAPVSSDLYNADPDHVLFTEDTGVAKEISIGSMYSEIVDNGKDLGHLYINDSSDANFMLYKTDKGVDTPADLKIWKYVEKE